MDPTFVLTDTQQAHLAVQFLDKKGKATKPDDVPVWASSDPTKVSVTPAADGLSADIVALDTGDAVQVSVTSTDKDGTQVVGVLTVNVVGGEAVSAGITPGTPTEQP
jgi:hypothetical protein